MKPVILITNDDGISAKGIRYLIQLMCQLGEVVVIAPDKPQSGMGHAVTFSNPLRLNLISSGPNYLEYSCNGTPADCVKLGQKVVLKQKPDLIVSGINHGSNTSVNILYSGTMAAVLEGAMESIPAIGFSVNDYSPIADFDHTEKYILSITRNVLQNGLPHNGCLNVNFPARQAEGIKGVKVVRQGRAYWDETFEERKDPRHRKYYWLSGEFRNIDSGTDNDEWAIANNYIAIVPIQLDMTDYAAIKKISEWNFND
ncbi:MAG: 5'/3'-nucleotidase SurE [Bacteroidota bacterium]|nr:5'/3'-nucleotidase SurE [Bacteroidota bacterium]